MTETGVVEVDLTPINDLVDVIKQSESTNLDTAEKLDKLIEKMIENEEAAAEEKELEKIAKELEEKELQENTEEVVELGDLYEVLQLQLDSDGQADSLLLLSYIDYKLGLIQQEQLPALLDSMSYLKCDSSGGDADVGDIADSIDVLITDTLFDADIGDVGGSKNEQVGLTMSFCEQIDLQNEKIDTLIEQGHVINLYGLAVLPSVAICLIFYKVLKFFI